MLSTSCASTGSVTALNTSGMPVPWVAAAALVAAGVAMGMIRSTLSATNRLQMSLMVGASPWPFSRSHSALPRW